MDIRFSTSAILRLWAYTFLLLAGMSAEHLLTAVTPSWDIAADMLLQNRIRDEGLLLTGHYSRWEFNHPGPFWFYYNHLVEWLLAPTGISRIQTWHWGSVFINSVLIVFTALALVDLLKPYRKTLFAGLSVTLISAFVGPELAGIWMPERMIAPYAAFLVCLPLLAAGRLKLLPVTVFLVCILVHGYVTMPVMTFPLMAGACWMAWKALNGWQGVRHYQIALVTSAAIILVFVMPMVLDYGLAATPNIEKILAAQSNFKLHDKPDIDDIGTFIGQLLFRDHALQWALVAPLLLLAWCQSARLWKVTTFKRFLLLLAATTLLVFAYYSRTPAPLFAFIAKFYLAVPPLFFLAILSRHSALALQNKRSLRLVQVVPSGVLALMLIPAMKMDIVEAGTDIQQAAQYLEAHSSSSPLTLNYTDHYQWPQVAGILLELDRKGISACTTWRHMAFLYTASQVCEPGVMPAFTLVSLDECNNDCAFTTNGFALQQFQSNPIAPGHEVGHASPQAFFHNWQTPEQAFRWSKGTSSSIQFYTTPSDFQGQLSLRVQPLGQQRLELTLNGAVIFSDTLTQGLQNLSISFDPGLLHAQGPNMLRFQMPDAKAPDGPDARILAIALHSLTLQ